MKKNTFTELLSAVERRESPQMIIPASYERRIRRDQQARDNQMVFEWFIPYAVGLGNLDGLMQRFDQCVIDRGSGMLDQLNKLQKAIYTQLSDMEKKYADIGMPDDEIKIAVHDRLSEYHNLAERSKRINENGVVKINYDPESYAALLELTKQAGIAGSLILTAESISRGGADARSGWRYMADEIIRRGARGSGKIPKIANDIKDELNQKHIKEMTKEERAMSFAIHGVKAELGITARKWVSRRKKELSE